jgi:hypothetical protein
MSRFFPNLSTALIGLAMTAGIAPNQPGWQSVWVAIGYDSPRLIYTAHSMGVIGGGALWASN